MQNISYFLQLFRLGSEKLGPRQLRTMRFSVVSLKKI